MPSDDGHARRTYQLDWFDKTLMLIMAATMLLTIYILLSHFGEVVL